MPCNKCVKKDVCGQKTWAENLNKLLAALQLDSGTGGYYNMSAMYSNFKLSTDVTCGHFVAGMSDYDY